MPQRFRGPAPGKIIFWGLAAAVLALYALVFADFAGSRRGQVADEAAGAIFAGAPVPRQFAARLPAPMPADPAARKQLFLSTVLPLVLRVNEDIGANRARLMHLRGIVLNGRPLTGSQAAWLRRLARRYGTQGTDFTTLLRRVGAVPPSLVVAQAAIESGWGSSRFAQQGNALFGQRVWRTGGGLVPTDRPPDTVYEVRSYKNLDAGIRAYVQNLNNHPAYEDFRTQRLKRGPRPDSLELAATLSAYSERGDEYVEILRQVIRENDLHKLDTARLVTPRNRPKPNPN